MSQKVCKFPGCAKNVPPGRRKYCSKKHLNFSNGKNYKPTSEKKGVVSCVEN